MRKNKLRTINHFNYNVHVFNHTMIWYLKE